MLFGLKNAPGSFQLAMDVKLSTVYWQFALVYLNDVVIFSKNLEAHYKHVRHVLTLHRCAGVSIKLKKSNFSLTLSTIWVMLFALDNRPSHNTPSTRSVTWVPQRILRHQDLSWSFVASVDVLHPTLRALLHRWIENCGKINRLASTNSPMMSYSR